MDLINEYLEKVCKFIKNKKVCFEIQKEIRGHIDELVELNIRRGCSRKEAIDKALKSLGDSESLGKELNKVHKEKFDLKLIGIILFLGIIGFLGTISFTNFLANNDYKGSLNRFAINDLLWIGIGMIFFFIGYKLKIKYIRKFYILFYILGIILVLGSRSVLNFAPWVLLGGLGTPILSIAPICFLVSIVSIYEKFNIVTNKQKLIVLFLEIAPLFFIVYKTKYVPLYLCYSIPLLIIIYINSENIKSLIVPFIVEIILFIEIGFKYLTVKSTNSGLVETILKTSKIIGRNAHTNPFINSNFPIVSAIGSYGILFGVVIIIGLLYFSFRIIKSARSIKNRYYKSLALIIGAVIVIEIILSILVNLNLVNIQITTFLISSGGYPFTIILFLLGGFNNIYRYKNVSITK